MKTTNDTQSFAPQEPGRLASGFGPSQRNGSPLDLILVAVVTALAAALRFYDLAAKSFWFDEGVSVAIARLDWYNFLRILWRREANMSLYYFLLHFWLHLGRSEFFIRSLSVLSAVASVPVLYVLGRDLFDSRTGIIAASLLAVNAYAIQYSQDARSYLLMVLLCLLCNLYFVRSLANPSRRNRVLYVLTSALAAYAHFFSLLLILVQWLSLRLGSRGEFPRQIRQCQRWIAILVAPVFLFVATTGVSPLRWVQRPGLRDLWQSALYLTGNGGVILLLAYAVACGGALWSQWNLKPKEASPEKWPSAFLILWLFFPPLFIFAISMIKPIFVLRYFIFCLPALLLLAACGLSRLRPAVVVPAILILLTLSLRGSMSYYQKDIDIQRDDWRAITRHVLVDSRPGDALMFHVPMGRMPYEFYRSLAGRAAISPDVLYPRHEERITFLDFVEKPDLAELARSLPRHPRVWLVLTYAKTPSGGLDARASSLSELLQGSYSLEERQDFTGVEVLLYQLKTTK